MEPGTILKINNTSKAFEQINKSKLILEALFEKSQKKIHKLKNLLTKEKEKNSTLYIKLENLNELKEKIKEMQEELSYKDKQIHKLKEKIKDFRLKSEDSDSET